MARASLGEVYFCPAGYPAISYGHVIKNGEGFKEGNDETQAEALLRQDTIIAERAALQLAKINTMAMADEMAEHMNAGILNAILQIIYYSDNKLKIY